jgi:hypothetical protein
MAGTPLHNEVFRTTSVQISALGVKRIGTRHQGLSASIASISAV